ncbi:MAG: hypothetical protein ACI9FN_003341, partial [Saprospiraceae bacterium]
MRNFIITAICLCFLIGCRKSKVLNNAKWQIDSVIDLMSNYPQEVRSLFKALDL